MDPAWLADLGHLLERKYHDTGKFQDLCNASALFSAAVSNTTENDPSYSHYHDSMMSNLQVAFDMQLEQEDIVEMVMMCRQLYEAHKAVKSLEAIQAMSEVAMGDEDFSCGSAGASDDDVGADDQTEKIPRWAVLQFMSLFYYKEYKKKEGIEDSDSDDSETSNSDSEPENQSEESDPEESDPEESDPEESDPEESDPEKAGHIEFLDKAIHASQEAIREYREETQTTIDGLPAIVAMSTVLARMLERRYDKTGQEEDLDEAIQLCRRASQNTPSDDIHFATVLEYLRMKLARRYKRTWQIEDIDELICLRRQTMKVIPGNDHKLLSDLGNLLQMRYDRTGQNEDLNEAIRLSRQAIMIAPRDEPGFAGVLATFGGQLIRLYRRSGLEEDLEESIQISRQAIQIMSSDDVDLEKPLNNLGIALGQRYERTGKMEDLDEAIEVLIKAVQLTSTGHINQTGLFINLGNSLERRYGQIGRIEDLNQATSIFLRAVELLPENDPELAGVLNGLGNKLFRGYLRQHIPEILDHAIRKTSKRHFKYLATGFRLFRLTTLTTLCCYTPLEPHLQVEGSIIVINMSGLRSDAIIVSSTGIDSVSLPRFNATEAQAWAMENMIWASPSERGRKNKEYRKFLAWLWHECVKPILSHLGHDVQSSPESLPRVWWIGTGIASFFPFHAASDFSAGSTEHTFCRVLSSYTVSIKALIHARERTPISPFSSAHPRKMLMVTMGTTPGADDLPGTETERSTVLEILGPCAQVEVLDQPDSASVIRQIPEYNIAHFACHGLSNWRTPLDSGLILQSDTGASPDTDNSGDTETLRQDILSVEKLCMSNLTQGEIAYLSACSTAQNTAVSVMDEMLHVVSGFQVAGFRHVIGTLWPSSDEVCAVVARSFYTELCRSGTVQYTDRDIALALNKASSALATSPDFQRRPLHWAPYIHYGA
ncbi:Tetratricopeptide-like helical [Penicillium expansum]|uniref:Tetratricopeptide-like helical n=1 Tax=Penicillium expansum TaxID=27334 RepID=A0A0A2K0H9_PENEN|nr:Tetratricopeptide-like helical [Penicillium expansum]KGO61197.1 Tetratricopeptide-like helical [Penicillium expansum]